MRRLLLALALLLLSAAPAQAAPAAGFGWPLPGSPTVQRGFDPPRTTYGAGHRGVDLGGTPGEPVLAAGPGQVTFVGLLAGRGVVTVTHPGGLRTTYEPVTASVRLGQVVGTGAVLGRLATGHASCALGTTCLHWGLLRGQTYLDPLGLVVAQQVRLLPIPAAGAAGGTVAGAGQLPLRPLSAPEGSSPSHRRSVGTVAAGGALVAGIGLLAGRSSGPRGPGPRSSPPAPIDLRAERRRRRVA